MPRKRWTPKKRLQPDYVPERDDLYLETGADYFHDCPLARNEAHLRAVWRQHGKQILTRYLAERHRHHRRPWAWWQFDAPEPRRPIGGTGTPLNAKESAAHVKWRIGEEHSGAAAKRNRQYATVWRHSVWG